MRLAGRIRRIDILTDVAERHRPASLALADGRRTDLPAPATARRSARWVYDTLRRRASLAARMGDEAPRALVIGALASVWGRRPTDRRAARWIATLPAPLSSAELAALGKTRRICRLGRRRCARNGCFRNLPRLRRKMPVAGRGSARPKRAPIDLRVNTLKADVPRC